MPVLGVQGGYVQGGVHLPRVYREAYTTRVYHHGTQGGIYTPREARRFLLTVPGRLGGSY